MGHLHAVMDWSLCIFCQKHSRDVLRCPALSNDAQAQVCVYEVFVNAYQAHRDAGAAPVLTTAIIHANT